ncbi:MAG: hypothetical protein Kow00107_05340 [Planctomycetota bacterium]
MGFMMNNIGDTFVSSGEEDGLKVYATKDSKTQDVTFWFLNMSNEDKTLKVYAKNTKTRYALFEQATFGLPSGKTTLRTQAGLIWKAMDRKKELKALFDKGITVSCPSACITALVLKTRAR